MIHSRIQRSLRPRRSLCAYGANRQSSVHTGSRPADAAFAQLAHGVTVGTQGPNLPGGCTTLAGQRACVPAVTVDGRRMADLVVLSKLVGVRGEPGAANTSLTSPEAVDAAIAAAVFDHLLYLQGVQDGFTASTAEAKAVAEQQLNAYESDPLRAQHADVIPAGMTPQAYFLSPKMLAAYIDGIIVGVASAFTVGDPSIRVRGSGRWQSGE